jgi:hypothetical protein
MGLPADPRMMMGNTLLAHLVSVQYKSGISIGGTARWLAKGRVGVYTGRMKKPWKIVACIRTPPWWS